MYTYNNISTPAEAVPLPRQYTRSVIRCLKAMLSFVLGLKFSNLFSQILMKIEEERKRTLKYGVCSISEATFFITNFNKICRLTLGRGIHYPSKSELEF
jgi:hypothetical protein